MGTITLTSPVAGTEIQAGLHATNYSNLQTLLNGNLDNTNISASAVLDAVARVGVRKNSAGSTFNRRRINLIEGTGITLTVADDSANEEVDVTIAGTSASSTVYRKVTEKVITNTTTETDLLNDEITIGANEMGANGCMIITIGGTYENQSGAGRTLRLRVKLGATTLWDSGATGSINPIAVTNRGWVLRAIIFNTGATNSQSLVGSARIGQDTGAATTGFGAWLSVAAAAPAATVDFMGTSAEDTTAGKTLKITAQHSAADTNTTVRMKHAHILVLNKA